MNIAEVKLQQEEDRRTIQLNIKIAPHQKEWIDKNGVSPTSIFHKALEELGYKKPKFHVRLKE